MSDVSTQEEKLKNWEWNEFKKDFSKMQGILFGTNGSMGSINRIEFGVQSLNDKIERLQKEVVENEKNAATEISTMKRDIEENKIDINNIGEIVREVRETLDSKSKNILTKINNILWPLVGVGVMTLIIMGIREFIKSAGG